MMMDLNRTSMGRHPSVGKEESQLIGNLLHESPGVRPMMHGVLGLDLPLVGARDDDDVDDSRIPLALSEFEEIGRPKTAPLTNFVEISQFARPRSAIGAWGSTPDFATVLSQQEPHPSGIPAEHVQMIQKQSAVVLSSNASPELMRNVIANQQAIIKTMMLQQHQQQQPQQRKLDYKDEAPAHLASKPEGGALGLRFNLKPVGEDESPHPPQPSLASSNNHLPSSQAPPERKLGAGLGISFGGRSAGRPGANLAIQQPSITPVSQPAPQKGGGPAEAAHVRPQSHQLPPVGAAARNQTLIPNPSPVHHMQHPPHPHAHLQIRPSARLQQQQQQQQEHHHPPHQSHHHSQLQPTQQQQQSQHPPPHQQPPHQYQQEPPPPQQQHQHDQYLQQQPQQPQHQYKQPQHQAEPPHQYQHQHPQQQQQPLTPPGAIQPVNMYTHKFGPQTRASDLPSPLAPAYPERDAVPTPPQGVLPPATPPQPPYRLQPAPAQPHARSPPHPFSSNGQAAAAPPIVPVADRFHHQQQAPGDDQPQHPRAGGNANPVLEEFKSTRSGGPSCTWDCARIKGHVFAFATDQEGSRLIQRRLENNAATDLDIVYYELLDSALHLMTDVFGNYVVQKILEHGSAKHQAGMIEVMEGHVVKLTRQTYGCRVIQKSLETCPLHLKLKMIKELERSIPQCVQDQNGNHVIQKCIECMPNDVDFIINAFLGQIATLATHAYGCRVIQKILEYCKLHPQSVLAAQCRPVMDEIIGLVNHLIRNQYGNYVLQHVMATGDPNCTSQIVAALQSRFFALSTDKFASNVVEKMFEYAPPSARSQIIESLISSSTPDGQSHLLALMKDQYANYVAQKIIDFANPSEQARIADHIRPHFGAFRKLSYGKHILSRIDKLDSGRRVGPKGRIG
ncbi:Pumilio-like protein 2 [Diplonema papillatum]|nr:Pumilio-like protein 2 [Diplonema papillatum]